jgi:DNA-binding NtrC family response regulator
VLETGELERVGGEQPLRVDARLIAATNRSPDEAVEEGKLREDLLYRLKVFSLHLVPLRERGNDVFLLAEHFLRDLNKNAGTSKTLSHSVLEALRAHSWPGNVRELKNVIEHAFILAEDEITALCLPPELDNTDSAEHRSSNMRTTAEGSELRIGVGTSLKEAEKRLINLTVDHCDGNKKRAAEVLGVSVKTIYNRLHSYEK